MISSFRKLTQSKFVRNVAIVATGTAGAQAIAMAFAPIITRLYGPEAFGMLGTFMAILAVVTPIAALTYPIAIVLPKSDADATSLAKLSAMLALSVATIVALILIITDEWIVATLNLQAISGLLLLIPLAMMLSAFQQILTQWMIRTKQFKITARVAVIQALAINSAKAGVGLFHPVGAALILLAMVGNAFHVFLLWIGIPRRGTNKPFDEVAVNSIRTLAKRHRDFPLFRAPQVALNALSQSLPVLMLASFFGPAAAGFYTLGKTVMGVPSTLIGKSVGDVFYPRITEAAHNKENLFKLILKTTLALSAIGFVPFALIIAFGPWIFSFVFGAEWGMAGQYGRWLALWFYFGFLNRPSVAAIATLGLQDFFLIYEIVSVTLRGVTLYIGFLLFKNDLISVALFSILGVILNTVLVLYTLHKSKRLS